MQRVYCMERCCNLFRTEWKLRTVPTQDQESSCDLKRLEEPLVWSLLVFRIRFQNHTIEIGLHTNQLENELLMETLQMFLGQWERLCSHHTCSLIDKTNGRGSFKNWKCIITPTCFYEFLSFSIHNTQLPDYRFGHTMDCLFLPLVTALHLSRNCCGSGRSEKILKSGKSPRNYTSEPIITSYLEKSNKKLWSLAQHGMHLSILRIISTILGSQFLCVLFASQNSGQWNGWIL